MTSIKEIKKAQRAIQDKILTLILAGFGLVAALAWNDAIQTLFSVLFPRSDGAVGKFVYAIIITVLVVIITLQLKRLSEEKE